ncbi:MAG: hypothetical protein WD424_05005 [Paenibacillaceae bacterium]
MNPEQIRKFLSSLTNEHRELSRCLDVLLQLQKLVTPAGPAPLLEVISVIKVEKPILFHHLKKSVKSNMQLQMLLEIAIPYDVAKQRLGFEETIS